MNTTLKESKLNKQQPTKMRRGIVRNNQYGYKQKEKIKTRRKNSGLMAVKFTIGLIRQASIVISPLPLLFIYLTYAIPSLLRSYPIRGMTKKAQDKINKDIGIQKKFSSQVIILEAKAFSCFGTPTKRLCQVFK
jgi:hypothetical protein